MLTDIEQLLIDFLLTSSAQASTGVKVCLILREEAQQLEMCQFLSDNPDASDEEILKMGQKISGSYIWG